MEMNNRADMGVGIVVDLSVDYASMTATSNFIELESGCNDADK